MPDKGGSFLVNISYLAGKKGIVRNFTFQKRAKIPDGCILASVACVFVFSSR